MKGHYSELRLKALFALSHAHERVRSPTCEQTGDYHMLEKRCTLLMA